MPVQTIPLLAIVGWTALLTLWQTSLVALIVWFVMRVDRRASASRRYVLASAALVLTTMLAAATLWVLLDPPHPAAAPRAATRVRMSPGAEVSPPAAAAPTRLGDTTSLLSRETPRLTPIAGAVWIGVASILLIRLLGGSIVAARTRRRAVPLHSDAMAASLTRVALALRLPHPVAVLRSDAVASPAVLGHRRPAVLLPSWLADADAAVLEPLLAHELAHVTRADFTTNLVQRLVEAVLAPFPGVHWLGRQIRHAREQCCDDAAVRACGDVHSYVDALTMLAARVANTPSALPAAGTPRLIDRIRRLLKGDSMPRLTLTQVLLTTAGTLILVATGGVVARAALDESARVGTSQTTGQIQSDMPMLPYVYLNAQPGAPLSITRVQHDDSHVFARVTVRNVSEKPITEAIFLIAVDRRGSLRPSGAAAADQATGRVARFYPRDVALAPGATTELQAEFLTADEVAEIKRDLGDRPQATLGVQRASFADGTSWEMTPDNDGLTTLDYFHIAPASVARGMVTAGPAGAPGVCRDDLGLAYSAGAIVPIRNEARAWARCVNGGWVDYQLPGSGGAAPR